GGGVGAHVGGGGPEGGAEPGAGGGLQAQPVPLPPGRLGLLPPARPHLGGAAGDDAQLGIALRLELADQRRRPRHRRLLAGLLQRRAHQLGEGVEVGLEVRLVQIPAVDASRRPRVDAVRQSHSCSLRYRPSRMAWTRSEATALAATFPALAMAWAFERPCALMNSRSNPRTGAPPYCCQSVTSLSCFRPLLSIARPIFHRRAEA